MKCTKLQDDPQRKVEGRRAFAASRSNAGLGVYFEYIFTLTLRFLTKDEAREYYSGAYAGNGSKVKKYGGKIQKPMNNSKTC
jgi:hypothetical protein